ncbi:unnamed protein product [Staurois parvus]|uniref:Uncharacterized protein n=1 Tax=Staurois parvus TaxID=386267 RepID=A0ABN9FE03_9NEOB|nr:unnamed protein product [Staurois parvus]
MKGTRGIFMGPLLTPGPQANAIQPQVVARVGTDVIRGGLTTYGGPGQ